MTERKVLNKYFPPDYDPSKIPRLPKQYKKRQFSIRTMAPFNMKCTSCNGYVYKGKKFNSRMEIAEGVTFLGLRHYRFYIRCPTCCSEIVYRTDVDTSDYVIETGAKRNFEALRTAERLDAQKAEAEEEELKENPMKALEKRTNQSKNEMERLEALEELKELKRSEANLEMTQKLLDKFYEGRQEENVEIDIEEEASRLIAEAKALREARTSTVGYSLAAPDSTDPDKPSTSDALPCFTQLPETSKDLPQALKNFEPVRPTQRSILQGMLKKKAPDPIAPSTSAAKRAKSQEESGCGNLLGLDYSDSDGASE